MAYADSLTLLCWHYSDDDKELEWEELYQKLIKRDEKILEALKEARDYMDLIGCSPGTSEHREIDRAAAYIDNILWDEEL